MADKRAFEQGYAALRAILLAASDGLPVGRDAPGDLIVRTATIDPATGEGDGFGTVTIRKRYVAYHLMPLYTAPALAEGLSAALAKRRQGKTCCNFTVPDPALFAELAGRTARVPAMLA